MSQALFDALKHTAGDQGYLSGDVIGPRYFTDPRGAGDTPPALVLRPQTTDQLSAIMKLCHAAGQPVVAQGGMTGLVVGARPDSSEVVISFERMNTIENVDTRTSTITVQSGVPLQLVQEQAEKHDLFYPLDLGSRGSCTVGGNLSTNAGGNRVIRYGMTRDLVLGLEAVLADGTVVSSMNRFIKNNAGYDLKQLFIGSEGTLGLITRAVLRLHRRPRSQAVAFCGAPSLDAVVGLMHHMQSTLGGNLSAFEVMWRSTYERVVEDVPGIKAPLDTDHAYFVLIETMGGDPDRDRESFETALGEAMEKMFVTDAVLAQSMAEITAFWEVRDGMATAMGMQQPAVGFDVSLSIEDMEYFVAEMQKRLAQTWNDARSFVGGHLGDGNLHLVAKAGDRDPQPRSQIEDIVYGLVGEIGGSVSAEHGIGTLKRKHLPQSRNPAEIALMRQLKSALDPKGLLGPGRVFELET